MLRKLKLIYTCWINTGHSVDGGVCSSFLPCQTLGTRSRRAFTPVGVEFSVSPTHLISGVLAIFSKNYSGLFFFMTNFSLPENPSNHTARLYSVEEHHDDFSFHTPRDAGHYRGLSITIPQSSCKPSNEQFRDSKLAEEVQLLLASHSHPSVRPQLSYSGNAFLEKKNCMRRMSAWWCGEICISQNREWKLEHCTGSVDPDANVPLIYNFNWVFTYLFWI